MQKIASAFFTGVALGVLTSFGQTYLPEPIKQFANSYSVWLLVSFLYGIFVANRTLAIVSGGIIQLAALIGYYATTELRFSAGYGTAAITLIWLAGGIIGGPLLGLAGYTYRHHHRRTSMLSLTCMVLVLVSEAIYMFAALHYAAKGICFLTLAFIVLASGLLYSRFTAAKNIARV